MTAMQRVQIRTVPLFACVTQAILEMENFVKVSVRAHLHPATATRQRL